MRLSYGRLSFWSMVAAVCHFRVALVFCGQTIIEIEATKMHPQAAMDVVFVKSDDALFFICHFSPPLNNVMPNYPIEPFEQVIS